MKHSGKRQKLVVGNWKMNPQSLEEAKGIFSGIKRARKKVRGVEVVICPPFPFIGALGKSPAPVFVGAQDVFWEQNGAFTGEVSARMLADSGASYVIVGHSERRALGETNDTASKKILAALKENFKVILCIGEKTRDHDGQYLEFLRNQLKESLATVPKRLCGDVVIAYEPIWAIGGSYSNAMTGADMQQISIYIHKVLADMYGKDESERMLVLYGGSVAPVNATDLASHGKVDGFLVGRQSLEAESFKEIMLAMAAVR